MLASSCCVICRSPLPPHQARIGQICGSASCRYRWEQIGETERCAGCGLALKPHELPHKVCSDPGCRRGLLARDAERERLRVESLTQRAEQLRGTSADAHRRHLTLIPSYNGSVVPLSAERRHNFREVLLAAIDQALFSDPGDDPADLVRLPSPHPLTNDVSSVLAKACGVCRGKCCFFGADHAFMHAKVIRRYLAGHPGATADEIADAYLSRLQDESCDNSCVYHGPQGCALPRDMRSHICNEALCPGLHNFVDRLETDESPSGFFAATTDEDVVEAAFIDAEQTRTVFSTRR